MKHSQNDISIVLRCSVQDSIIAVAQIWPTPDAFIRPSAWVDGTWAVRSWSEPPNRFTVGWHVTMLQPACVLRSFKQEQTAELISFHTVYWQGEGVWCVLVIWNCECVRIIIMVCFVFFLYENIVTDQDVIMWIYFPTHFRPTADVVVSLCT